MGTHFCRFPLQTSKDATIIMAAAVILAWAPGRAISAHVPGAWCCLKITTLAKVGRGLTPFGFTHPPPLTFALPPLRLSESYLSEHRLSECQEFPESPFGNRATENTLAGGDGSRL